MFMARSLEFKKPNDWKTLWVAAHVPSPDFKCFLLTGRGMVFVTVLFLKALLPHVFNINANYISLINYRDVDTDIPLLQPNSIFKFEVYLTSVSANVCQLLSPEWRI